MPSYLVETFLARGRAGERTASEARARSAAAELTQAGTEVSFDGVIHVPEDEICFFMFGAPSSRDAALVGAASRARPASRGRGGHVRRRRKHMLKDSSWRDVLRSFALLVVAALTVLAAPARCPGGHGDGVERERVERAVRRGGAGAAGIGAAPGDGARSRLRRGERDRRPLRRLPAHVTSGAAVRLEGGGGRDRGVPRAAAPRSGAAEWCSTRSTPRRWRRFRTARRRHAGSGSGRPLRRR